MVYAVVEAGGKQYRVREGDLIKVENLPGELGERVEVGPVLMLRRNGDVHTDSSLLRQVKVIGEIVEHGRYKKIVMFKYKRRKNYRRKKGHRQCFTALRIVEIATPGL